MPNAILTYWRYSVHGTVTEVGPTSFDGGIIADVDDVR